MRKIYLCTKDLQGGDWSVGKADTIEGWRERAIMWADSDGFEGTVEYLEKLEANKVIDFIQDYWQIEIKELIKKGD